MATSVTLRVSDRFPAGTSVSAYPASGRVNGAAPSVSATSTATVGSDGSLTLTGLAYNTAYVAYALVSGDYRYVSFVSDRVPVTDAVYVTAHGATGDGVTDDTTAINAAYAEAVAAGKGLLFSPGSYVVSGSGLNINQNAHIEISGYGATIIPASGAVGITVNPGVSTGSGLGAVIEGFLFRPVDPRTQTAIKIHNASRFAFRDLNIYSGAIGFDIVNDGVGGYCEDNHFENIYIASCATGLKFSRINTGDVSLEENTFEHVGIAGCDTGIWLGAGLEFRTVFMNAVKVWATQPGSQTCLLLEGDVIDWYAQLHLENLSPSTGNTALHFTSTAANLDKAHVDIGYVGTFTNKVTVDTGTTAFVYTNGRRIEWGGKTGGNGLSARRDTDTQDRFQLLASPVGFNFGVGGSTAFDTNLYRNAANVLKTDDRLVAADGVTTKTKAGTPADGDFQGTPDDGTLVLNTSSGMLWTRSGGGWVPAATRAGLDYLLSGSQAVYRTTDRVQSLSTGSPLATTGLVVHATVVLPAGAVISNIAMRSGTTALTQGTNNDGHWWFALYDTQATPGLLASTADQGTASWAINTPKRLPIARDSAGSAIASYTIPTTGVYRVSVMVNPGTGGAPAVPNLVLLTLGSTDIADGLAPNQQHLAQTSGSGIGATPPSTIASPTSITNLVYAELY